MFSSSNFDAGEHPPKAAGRQAQGVRTLNQWLVDCFPVLRNQGSIRDGIRCAGAAQRLFIRVHPKTRITIIETGRSLRGFTSSTDPVRNLKARFCLACRPESSSES